MRASARGALFAVLLCAAPGLGAQQEATVGGFKLSEFPADDAPPAFRLVSAGAEPRRALRYRLAAGSVHKYAMTLRMSVGVEIDGRSAPVQRAPAMRMLLECRVAEADERQARLDFRTAEPPELLETEGVAPAMLEALRKNFENLSAMRGHVAITSRGVVTSSRVEFGPGIDQSAAQVIQSMQQSLEQASVPLPEDAVGVGAQWKMLLRLQGAGLRAYQVAAFKIVRIEGEVVTIAVSVEQFAPRQQMPGPAPAGARAELTSMQASGEGESAVDLTSPMPRSSAAFDQTLRMRIQAQERTLQMGMRNRMQVQIEPVGR